MQTLKRIDLSKSLDKPEYKARMKPLELRLGELQRRAREAQVPVIVVFEGWDAAGKGTMINKLLLALDPRGFNVYPTSPPTEEERFRPFLWRFWTRTPARGRIAIFDRSWYGRVLIERVDKQIPKEAWHRAYHEINWFERQLSDDGAVLIKFFLHISKATQKRRFRKLLGNPATEWKVTDEDWRHHRQYGKYEKAIEEMLVRTSTAAAPWTVVEAEDERFAAVKIFETVAAAMEKKRRTKRAGRTRSPRHRSALDEVDLSLDLGPREYEAAADRCQERLWELEHEVYRHRVPVVIVYEGWDAAGKGGNIKRLVRGLDPRGYEVVPITAPNDVEKSHHYLWRFWSRFPKAGHIAVFDRSWYGRVMVERVEGFCRPDEWQRAYREINEMEAEWAGFGAVLVKFWLHISADEQLRRFNERQHTDYKRWKITEEDWRNRKKWDRYKRAVDEMIARTSEAAAPWTIIEAESKRYARIKAMKTVIRAIEQRLER
jgi:AMP-polyphosphate phosphotransferase